MSQVRDHGFVAVGAALVACRTQGVGGGEVRCEVRGVSKDLRLQQPGGWGCRAQGEQMEYPLIRGGADLSSRCAQETERAGRGAGAAAATEAGRWRAGAGQ